MTVLRGTAEDMLVATLVDIRRVEAMQATAEVVVASLAGEAAATAEVEDTAGAVAIAAEVCARHVLTVLRARSACLHKCHRCRRAAAAN